MHSKFALIRKRLLIDDLIPAIRIRRQSGEMKV